MMSKMNFIIIFVLIFASVFGNYCLLNGSDFSGETGTFLIVITVLADILIIFLIAKGLVSVIQRKRQSAEYSLDDEKHKSIRSIVNRFKPEELIFAYPCGDVKLDSNYIDTEFVSSFLRFKQGLEILASECQEVDFKINEILSCPGCSSLDENHSYLNSMLDSLVALKSKSDALHRQIHDKRFKFEDNNESFCEKIDTAFDLLLKSKVCICEEGNINIVDRVSKKTPTELCYFDLDYAPKSLIINGHYFCLLECRILVFDKNGLFCTALRSDALKINVEKYVENIYYIDGCAYSSHKYVSEDSKCLKRIKTGNTTPESYYQDRYGVRYKNGKKTGEYTEIREYAVITVHVANKKVRFTVSSELAINAFISLADDR